jgi:hypothetical protein
MVEKKHFESLEINLLVKVIGENSPIGNPVKRTDRARCRISLCVTEAWSD